MNKLARLRRKTLREPLHGGSLQKGGSLLPRNPEDVPQAMIDEILLLPAVEPLVKGKLQVESLDIGITAGNAVEQHDPAQHRLVEWATNLPGLVASGPEILLPEILEPKQPLAVGFGKDTGHGHAVRGEETSQGGVVLVLLLLT